MNLCYILFQVDGTVQTKIIIEQISRIEQRTTQIPIKLALLKKKKG